MLKIASISFFVLAFVCGMIVFTRVGSTMISVSSAKQLMLAFGGIALFLNILSSKSDGKESQNLLFWLGSFVVFAGLFMRIYLLPYSTIVLILGMLLSALSFFWNPFQQGNSKQTDIIDEE